MTSSDTLRARPNRGFRNRLVADRLTLAGLWTLGVIVALAALAPVLGLPDPDATRLEQRLARPFSEGHLLGTDHLGRDMLSRLLYGARLSLLVALFGVGVAAGAGTLIGLVAGYYGRFLDSILMRSVDVLMAFPYLLLALSIVAVLGPGLANAALAIAVVNVPFFARTVRGQMLALKREDFVDAAKMSGLSGPRILFSEILPDIVPVIAVAVSTSIGWMILETAGLSFLGLGAQPPTADLGGMLGQGRHLLATAPHVSLVPGLFIFVVVIAMNVVGDGLRDALDPKFVPSGGLVSSNGSNTNDNKDHAGKPLLLVDGLTVSFAGSSREAVAVDGVRFSVERGERVGLVGESGSGKSVSALSILGLLPPPGRVVSGRVWFDGLDLLVLSEHDWSRVRGGRIAWIPQDPSLSLHPMYRIGDQLEEVLSLHRDARDAALSERAEQLLAEVGLPDPKQRLLAWPHELSGGMRQRVVIAMALAGNPELIIADEATTALDVTTQAQVLELLMDLCHEKGVALLFISHDLSVVSELCERVLVMQSGKIVEDRPTEDVISKPEATYTRRLIASIPRLGQRDRLLSPSRVGSRSESGGRSGS